MGKTARHGGKLLVEQLKALGVTRVFSVPGESFLPVLDGLFDSGIENIVCRHEGGAAMMAEAAGKVTGAPGVVFVTRGPGATNASSGIHVARQDSTPLVMFVGQIARAHRDREAFQELDYRSVFGSMAKWVAEVEQTDRLPEYVNRAFRLARSGRPGPVVLALPEDMLSEQCTSLPISPTPAVTANNLRASAEIIMKTLQKSHKPMVIVGGSGLSQEAADHLAHFAELHDLPVATTFRRQDYMDNTSLRYVGDLGVGMNPKLAQRLRDADCLLILGSRFGDVPTNGYELVTPDARGKIIIHVHPDPNLPGTWLRTDFAVTAHAPELLAELAEMAPPTKPAWENWRRSARADYEAWQIPHETPGAVKMEKIVGWLSHSLPDDAIITNGAGNFAAFVHRYFSFRRFGTQLAPTSGSMGYGFPAAIAAKLAHPERTVVCMAGDGDFQMTLNEFSTARQHRANVIVVVANNGRYGTIRMHQERHYPRRVSGTDLANPDFAAFARSYGGHGETVRTTEEFPAAFERAQAAGKPAVIELRLDSEALTTALTLSEVRAAGLALQ